mmetsp:Transcript_5428/g.11809  ORF Transcript_5428/g.11809 Transcript_5428/m.11809 type:complete len:86 (-) Transcript_5428:173-430(-)
MRMQPWLHMEHAHFHIVQAAHDHNHVHMLAFLFSPLNLSFELWQHLFPQHAHIRTRLAERTPPNRSVQTSGHKFGQVPWKHGSLS